MNLLVLLGLTAFVLAVPVLVLALAVILISADATPALSLEDTR